MGLAGTVTNCTIVAAAARNGSYGARVAPTAAAAGSYGFFTDQGPQKRIFRFAFRLTTPPSSGSVRVFEGFFSTTHLVSVQVSSAGLVTASLDGTNYVGSTSISATLTGWHYVEIKVDGSTATAALTWRLDGVDQTGTTFARTASGFSVCRLGTSLATGPAATIDFDDLITAAWSVAGDWFGDGKVLAQFPGVDGTHSNVAKFANGDTGVSLTTPAYQYVDDPAPWTTTRSSTDNLSQQTADATPTDDYLEIGPVPSTETGPANAIRGIIGWSTTATTANSSGSIIRSAAAVEVAIVGTSSGTGDISDTTMTFRGRPHTTVGWTTAEVNSAVFRIGFSNNDVAPRPVWQMMMFEVDWQPSAAPAAEVTEYPLRAPMQGAR